MLYKESSSRENETDFLSLEPRPSHSPAPPKILYTPLARVQKRWKCKKEPGVIELNELEHFYGRVAKKPPPPPLPRIEVYRQRKRRRSSRSLGGVIELNEPDSIVSSVYLHGLFLSSRKKKKDSDICVWPFGGFRDFGFLELFVLKKLPFN